ncbi:MAG: electron transfer flavoprotein subunit beta/FixA family protein [Thaumarchaeota archaeon]|jgi:electron transfer flavoprotein beta subunit|nr:electron transfer flavoprotein subunit beta/FixA family protein [Nitrososphaerota archaeon]
MSYNTFVLIKAVVDDVRIDPKTGEPSVAGAKYKMDDISRNAVEEAVRIKEKHGGKASGIIFGDDYAGIVIKEALAMGLDEGFMIKGYRENDPRITAQIISKKLQETTWDLILMGYSSADSYTAQLPPRIARLLNRPLMGNAIKLELNERKARATLELEEFNALVEGELPVVVSVAQEINVPRIPTLLQIMAASRKPLKVETPSINYPDDYKVVSNIAPQSARKRIVYEDIAKGVEEISRVLKG